MSHSYPRPRWTKKHGRSFFGYKKHVNADTYKLIRHHAVSNAAVPDCPELDGLLDKTVVGIGPSSPRGENDSRSHLIFPLLVR